MVGATNAKLVVLLWSVCLVLAACTKFDSGGQPGKAEKVKALPTKEVPADPLEFRRYLLKHHPKEMAATVCQCCNKSLGQCYEETLEEETHGCPDT